MTYSPHTRLQDRKRPFRTFRAFIRAADFSDDPPGDFAADVRADPDFPYVKTWRGVTRYLANMNACEGAVEAAAECWDMWTTYCLHQSRDLYKPRPKERHLRAPITAEQPSPVPNGEMTPRDLRLREFAVRCSRMGV